MLGQFPADRGHVGAVAGDHHLPRPVDRAAIATVSGYPAAASSALASSQRSAAIAPPAGSSDISRPRAVTSLAASARSNTPATQAAVISPTLCPASADGRRPQERSSPARAYSRAKSAGWV